MWVTVDKSREKEAFRVGLTSRRFHTNGRHRSSTVIIATPSECRAYLLRIKRSCQVAHILHTFISHLALHFYLHLHPHPRTRTHPHALTLTPHIPTQPCPPNQRNPSTHPPLPHLMAPPHTTNPNKSHRCTSMSSHSNPHLPTQMRNQLQRRSLSGLIAS